MKKKILKILLNHLIIFTVALLMFQFSLRILAVLEKKWSEPVEITFDLPFPPELEQKYGLIGKSQSLDPYRVVITGFFSDWDPDNDAYSMKKVGDGKWKIKLSLPPGDNQYKFAVHVENKDPEADDDYIFWVHDRKNSLTINDSFGGFNSVYRIPSAKKFRSILNIAFVGLIIIILLFSFLEPLFKYILNLKFRFQYKIIINALIFGLLTNFVYIAINIYQQREIIKEAVIDNFNLIHLTLKGKGINFADLDYNENLEAALNNLFYDAKARIEKDKISNNQVTLSTFAIFDTEFDLLRYSIRGEASHFLESRLDIYDKDDYEDYFTDIVFKDLILEIKRKKNFNETSYGKLILPVDTAEHKKYASYLGFTQIMHPIFYKRKLVGYYAAEINAHLYGKIIESNLYFNLGLIPVLIILYFFLFSIVGKWITKHLNLLIKYTEKIKEGDFSFRGDINSGDEIEKLAYNFGVMCDNLEQNFEKINNQNLELTELKDTLEIKVHERTKELKFALSELEKANVKLEEMSIKDPLTDVYNRRHFDKLSAMDLQKAIRKKYSLTVIMIDLDDFKCINDNYGHLVGDKALVMAAQAIKSSLKRPGDILARYGGEEFVVLLSDTEDRGAIHIAQDIRKAIELISLKDGEINLTASIGICSAVPGTSTEIADYLKLSDEALYRAKGSGKNRVETASPMEWVGVD